MAHATNDKTAKNSLKDKPCPALYNWAKQFHKDVDVFLGLCTAREIQIFEVYQCRLCFKVILRRDSPMEKHKYGTARCPSCREYVVFTDLRCFLRKEAPKT